MKIASFAIIAMHMIGLGCSGKLEHRERIKELSADPGFEMAYSIGEYVHKYPNDAEVLSSYSRLLFDAGYMRESILLARKALILEKDGTQTLLTLAMALARDWQFEESLRIYSELLNRDGQNGLVLQGFKNTWLQNDVYKRVQAMDSAILQHPSDLGLVRHRADLLLKMQEGKAAMADYEWYLDSSGYDPDVSFNRFRAAILTGVISEAEREINRMNSADPHAITQLVNLREILRDSRAGQEMMKSSPRSARGYELTAKSLVYLRLEPAAIPLLEKAFSIDSENAALKKRLAYVYSASGYPERARDLYGGSIPSDIENLLNK